MIDHQTAVNAVKDNCFLSAPPPAAEKDILDNIDRPSYAAGFRCIGPSCEDPCCTEWDIPLDKNTYEKYHCFPDEQLSSTVSRFVIINQPNQPEELYGLIRRKASGSCPFYSADRLCEIQKKYGHELLSASCSIYPRSLSVLDGKLEGALSLSCPEAARSLLLIPDFMSRVYDLHSGEFRTDNVYHLAYDENRPHDKPKRIYLPLRRMLMDIVRDSSKPLWHRLLKIGYLCRELGSLDAKRIEFLLQSNFLTLRALSESALLEEYIGQLERNPKLRLETVFGLTERLMRGGSSVRFQDTFWSFVSGVGRPVGSIATNDMESFLHAEQEYLSPFSDKFPFILENYLINYMFQTLFPYGRSGSLRFSFKNIFDEYLQMATQFAWVNGLLIGTAGNHKSAFAEEHVVKVIQSFTRAFEHDPSGLEEMNAYVHSCGLDNLQGMAILLKS